MTNNTKCQYCVEHGLINKTSYDYHLTDCPNYKGPVNCEDCGNPFHPGMSCSQAEEEWGKPCNL